MAKLSPEQMRQKCNPYPAVSLGPIRALILSFVSSLDLGVVAEHKAGENGVSLISIPYLFPA